MRQSLQYIIYMTLVATASVQAHAAEKTVLLGQANATTQDQPSPLLDGKLRTTTGTVTLEAVIERALSESPLLKSSASSALASKAERAQSTALPNPELGIEAENIHGQGPYQGTDSAEITYGVSQLVEVSGKRSARQDIASRGYETAKLEHEAARLDLIRDVTISYAVAVAAQEEVTLAKEQKKLASEVLDSVTKRVAAAAEPMIQKNKAEVAMATSDIALNSAVKNLEIAKLQLASLWGEDNDSFTLNASDFFSIQSPDSLTDLASRLATTPDIARLDSQVARARANLDLEQANAIPDPTVSVGVREFRESSNQAFVVGLSLPIPVLNLNQGNIAKAHHEVSKSETDKQAVRLSLSVQLTRAAKELKNAYAEARKLKSSILPAAQKAFSLSRQSYQTGRLPYLEVLDAQRTLSEARSQYIAALRNYHTQRAEVERLTAAHSTKIQLNEDIHE